MSSHDKVDGHLICYRANSFFLRFKSLTKIRIVNFEKSLIFRLLQIFLFSNPAGQFSCIRNRDNGGRKHRDSGDRKHRKNGGGKQR